MPLRFNSEVAKMIAKPCTKEGIPFYTRVDGMVECSNGVERVPENSEYARKSREICTSPDNIKRIFITCNGVFVHLHKPVFGSGQGTSLKRQYTYSGSLNDAHSISSIIEAKKYIRMQAHARTGHEFQQFCPRNEDGKPIDIELDGFGFGALYKPHVYQNVEEIYMDWLPLSNMSNDRACDFSTFCKENSGEAIKRAIMTLFVRECGAGVSNILSRYPRLHTIGYIENLGNIYELVDHNQRSDNFERWFDYAYKKLADKYPPGDCAILKVRKTKDWIVNWSIKDGTYVFDRDVLQGYRDEVERKYSGLLKQARKDAVEAAKSPVERQLDEMYEQSGSKFTQSVLKAMVMSKQITPTDIEVSFTPQGAKKYLNMIR